MRWQQVGGGIYAFSLTSAPQEIGKSMTKDNMVTKPRHTSAFHAEVSVVAILDVKKKSPSKFLDATLSGKSFSTYQKP